MAVRMGKMMEDQWSNISLLQDLAWMRNYLQDVPRDIEK